MVPFQLDRFGTAVAAPLDQLVSQVLDGVPVRFLVAVGALGNDAHASVLVADTALGQVGAVLAVVGEFVGAQELVAAVELDVALEDRAVGLAGVQCVAGDIGRLPRAVAFQRGGFRRVLERGHRVIDRAQAPVFGIVGRMGGQGEGDAQRKWEQAEAFAHAAIRWAETVASLPHPRKRGNADGVVPA